MKQKQQFRGLWMILSVSILILWITTMAQKSLLSGNMTYQEFMVAVENKTIEAVHIEQNPQTPTGNIYLSMIEGEDRSMAVSDVVEIQELLKVNQIDFILMDVPQENYLMTVILPIGVSVMLFVLMFLFMNARAGGGGNSKMANFGKSRAKMSKTNNVDFSKVAGLSEEKEDLVEVVDFLKDPKKYTDVGARIPKGVLLVGPPGTGKTLLAKAVAGEAGVPF